MEDRYADPYRALAGKAFLSAEFYGMIAHIDENYGRLVDFLEESGHRVPFFIRWPASGIEGGTDIDELTAHVDLLHLH